MDSYLAGIYGRKSKWMIELIKFNWEFIVYLKNRFIYQREHKVITDLKYWLRKPYKFIKLGKKYEKLEEQRANLYKN